MQERWRSTHVEVHLPHLIHNFKLLKSCVNEAPLFCPMIKADAYGHGDVEVASALERHGPTTFGVVLVEEGVKLRRAGIQSPILIFGSFDADSSEATVNFNLTPVLSDWSHVRSFEHRLAEGDLFPVHLKFNTGMSRMGFEPTEAAMLAVYFAKQSRMRVAGICTHLQCGEDLGAPGGRTETQMAVFDELFAHFKTTHAVPHYLNSSGIIARPPLKVGARPGIALYGVMPPTLDQIRAHLLPVMNWKSTLSLVRNVRAGQTVSYGATWTAKRDSLIGVVPVGYGDGYARAFSNRGIMLYRGRRVPVVGIVCMDYTMIDLTDAAHGGTPQIGDEVVLLGKQGSELLKVEELASLAGTIPYEILTRVSLRVPRLYTH